MASENASGIKIIRPASKNTGIAITSPVIPSAQAAFLSPNHLTMVTASVCAPPDISRIAPNMEPSPTSNAIPFSVLPIPSFTAVTISSTGIPAIRPMAIAPVSMEIIAWILNLIISTSSITSPMIAAITSLVGFNAAVSEVIIFSSLSILIMSCFYPQWKRVSSCSVQCFSRINLTDPAGWISPVAFLWLSYIYYFLFFIFFCCHIFLFSIYVSSLSAVSGHFFIHHMYLCFHILSFFICMTYYVLYLRYYFI